jgi:hypothetical protein
MKSWHPFRTAGVLLAGTSFFVGLALIMPALAAEPPDARPRPPEARPMPPEARPVPIPRPPPNYAVHGGFGAPPSAPVPWKDPDWPEPGKLLPELNSDSLPVREVARYLQQEFPNAFDVLIPSVWQDPLDPSVGIDPGSATVRLQLRNVSASEIFNAMNMMFEAENSPYHWELRLNGNRPVAMLRVIPQKLPPATPQPPTPPVTRMVHFVGDLLEPSGTAMQDLVKTVSDIYEKAYGSPKGVIQFHKESQLLIVSGTAEQISFVQLTLSALREKTRFKQLSAPKPDPNNTRPNDFKP